MLNVTLTRLDGAWFPRTCCGAVFGDARELMDHLLDPRHPQSPTR